MEFILSLKTFLTFGRSTPIESKQLDKTELQFTIKTISNGFYLFLAQEFIGSISIKFSFNSRTSETGTAPWTSKVLGIFEDVVWHVSWYDPIIV